VESKTQAFSYYSIRRAAYVTYSRGIVVVVVVVFVVVIAGLPHFSHDGTSASGRGGLLERDTQQ
jgi:hypothetical protein